jgi:hypothetical protein
MPRSPWPKSICHFCKRPLTAHDLEIEFYDRPGHRVRVCEHCDDEISADWAHQAPCKSLTPSP